MAVLALPPDVSSDSLTTEGLALDLSHFTTSLPSLRQHSVGEQKEILNQDISHQSNSKHSSSSVREQLLYKLIAFFIQKNPKTF